MQLSEGFDGYWTLCGILCPQDGQLLNQVLEAGISQQLQAKRDGDPTLDNLTIANLRAQALNDLAAGSLRREPGWRSRPDRHHVNLIVRLEADGALYPEAPLPVEALCDATLTRIVLGADRKVLDIGRTTRIRPDSIANAIRLRDQHCTLPHRAGPPAGAISITAPSGNTAETPPSPTNGTLLCRWHHTFLHTKHWTVHLDRHQRPVFTRPDGQLHHPVGLASPPGRTGARH